MTLLDSRNFATLILIHVWTTMAGYSWGNEGNWVIKVTPIRFGETVMIYCPIQPADNTTTRQWHGGPHYDLLLFDGISLDYKKYRESFEEKYSTSTLLIVQFNETDVNWDYGCTIGFNTFKKPLLLDEKLFQYVPKPDMIHQIYHTENDTATLAVEIEKIFPIPLCTITFGISVVEKPMLVLKNGLFYRAFLNESFRLNLDVNISCYLGSEPIILWNSTTKGKNQVDHGNSAVWIATVLGLVGTCLPVVFFILYLQIRKKTIAQSNFGKPQSCTVEQKAGQKLLSQTNDDVDVVHNA